MKDFPGGAVVKNPPSKYVWIIFKYLDIDF